MDELSDVTGLALPGGYINPVVKIGDTVRRQLSPNAEFVHALLRHFEACGFEAPRFLGLDDAGREVLSFVEGHVAWQAEQPPGVWTDESLVEVARLTRRFHDLTVGTPLVAGREVVCHNDLSPRNTVYRDSGQGYRPVTFIDWDDARPGDRVDDLAFSFWSYLHPCPRHANIATHARRIRAMLDVYGYTGDRTALIELMVAIVAERLACIITEAAAGSEPHQRIIRLGAIEEITESLDWLRANQAELAAAVG